MMDALLDWLASRWAAIVGITLIIFTAGILWNEYQHLQDDVSNLTIELSNTEAIIRSLSDDLDRLRAESSTAVASIAELQSSIADSISSGDLVTISEANSRSRGLYFDPAAPRAELSVILSDPTAVRVWSQ